MTKGGLHKGANGEKAFVIAALIVCLLHSDVTIGQSNRNKKKPPNRRPAAKINLPTQGKGSSVRIKIASVDPRRSDAVKKSAEQIDILIAANHQRLGMTPNPMTTDEQFLRRVYLDITGTIPTYKQAKTFLESRSPNKRSQLIDRLLNSPGYASHMYNYWANILRLKDRPEPNIIADPYNQWVKQAIRDNMPYDQMAHEMLTAEGKIWDNPATGYTLRDSGMPLDAMNNTVRVFLGTRIGCAQCHDHPFDRWTQREFYEIAAYTYGTRTRLNRNDPELAKGNPLNKLRQELTKIDPKNRGFGTFTRLVRANTYYVRENPRARLKLPHDYAYQDGDPGDPVTPKTIFGDETKVKYGNSPRKAFADWMTSKENPRFAGTIANRMWKRAFGVGQIEPVDEIMDESRPESMPLMRFLVYEMKRLDFNLKEFQRILYNTKTYQRQSTTTESVGGAVYHFQGPILRRMTAEQAWDSLLTLAIYNPDSVLRPSAKSMAAVADLDLTKATAKEVLDKANQFDEKFGRKALQEIRRKQGYKGQILARASELQAPLPADHFLRQFGQGDRELIDGASTEGTVPQILTMFNGPVTHMMLERGSVIYDNVMAAKTVNEQMDVIFLSLLSRKPTAADRTIALREMRTGAAGYGNVIWALLNTREFLFIQ